MKKNIILFCCAGIMSMSLISCNGKEKKIDNATGNELVNVAIDKTTDKLEEISTKSFLGLSLNANLKGDFNMVNTTILEQSSYNMEGTSILTINGNLDASAELQTNLDVDGIRKTPNADITNTESYMAAKILGNLSTETDLKFQNNPNLDNSEKSESKTDQEHKIYQKGLNLIQYDKVDDNETTAETLLTTDEVNNIASQIVNVLDAFSGQVPPVDNSSVSELINQGTIVSIQTKTDDFLSGKMTANDYLTFIDETFAEGKLFDNTPQGTRDCVVSLLEVAYEVNPSKYFEYTKITEKKNVTLNSSFDYTTWKVDLNSKLDAKINAIDTTNPSYILLSTIKPIIISVLPTVLNLDYTIKIHSDGYINAMNFDVKVQGTIPGTVLSFIGVSTSNSNMTLTYNGAFNGGFGFDVSDDRITIKTLELPSKD